MWAQALPPCLAQSSAAFSFPVFERVCGVPQGWQSYIVFGECVIYQDCMICGDPEVGHIPIGSTTWCLAVFHAVICRHHVRADGRSWSGTEATMPCWLEVWVLLLRGNMGKRYIRWVPCGMLKTLQVCKSHPHLYRSTKQEKKLMSAADE